MSLSTLDRRIASGEIQVTREPHGRRHRVYVMLDDDPPDNGVNPRSQGTLLDVAQERIRGLEKQVVLLQSQVALEQERNVGLEKVHRKGACRARQDETGDFHPWLGRRRAVRAAGRQRSGGVAVHIEGCRCFAAAESRTKIPPAEGSGPGDRIILIDSKVANRIVRYDNRSMTSREFIRRAREYARNTGQSFRFDPTHGKGSHGRVYIGSRFTTVQRGELNEEGHTGRDAASVEHRPKGVLSHDIRIPVSIDRR